MTDELKLTLPERPGSGSKTSGPILVLLLLSVALAGAAAVLSWRAGRRPAAEGLPPAKTKEVALKLEQQDLKAQAIAAWREYLATPGLPAAECAKVWYRIGTLAQGSGDSEAALAAYYRSEACAPVPELAPEISRRVQECLERSGKFADLQHELRERTSAAQNAPKSGDVIVAEIGPRKITLEELDRRIEKMIDLQLEQVASALPSEERAKQREASLKRYSTPEARGAELRRFVVEEVLMRKAREERLQDDPAVKDLLAMAERQILAGKEMGKELNSKIHITDSDLKNYYEAHKADFKEKKEGQAERPKSFDEARPDVYAALRRQKEQEVQQELFGALEQKYDVVIHNDALKK